MGKHLRFSEGQLAEFMARGQRTQKAVDAVEAAAVRVLKEDVDRKMRASGGDIEAMFELQLLEVKWPALCEPRFQWPPLEGRKFRLDVAFPFVIDIEPVGIEVQGHVHRVKKQFLADMERHNLLTEAGWTMYYVSGDMVRDGRAVALAKRVIRSGAF